MLEHENVLRDALHCASIDVTRGIVLHQRYGRGVVSGVYAGWLALGYSQSVAAAIVRNCLPTDTDPMCIPNSFPWKYEPGRFRVIEHLNGFEVEDSRTGKRHWLSDGVDCVGSGKDFEFLSPGTPGFTESWECELNANEEETWAAYFGNEAAAQERQ